MNVDLTSTFKDARRLLTEWKGRYSKDEYPKRVVMNIFYRKYGMEKMWPNVLHKTHKSWEAAYEQNKHEYAGISQNEVVPVLEAFLMQDKKVTSIRFSDFNSFINAAAKGDADAIKGIEYTYFLNRVFDELTMMWLSFVNSGLSGKDAITKLTGAILPPQLQINSYAEVESLFDQLGAEAYLRSLLIKEHNKQL